METAKKITSRIARKDDLLKIEWSYSSLRGVGAVPASARPWIYWFATLIKLGYAEIRSPVWAITRSAFQSCAKNTNSDASTRRALRWLEDNGYLNRRNLRIGSDCRGTIIDINISRFEFFLRDSKRQKRQKTCDKDLHQSICEGDNLTSNKDSLQTYSKSRIYSKCINSKKSANKEHKHHPIVHTIWCVTGRGQDPRTWPIIRAARKFVQSPDDIGRYWIDRWPDLSKREREYFARAEILPFLIAPAFSLPTQENSPSIDNLTNSVLSSTPIPLPGHQKINPDISLGDQKTIVESQNRLIWARRNAGFE